MKMYTAGYTGHDGYPVTLAEGDNIEEVIGDLPFDVDVSDLPKYPGKTAIPRIVEAIQKHEGSSGWVREAPYTVMAGHTDEPGSWTVSWRVSGSSLEEVITAILYRSDRFAEQVSDGTYNGEVNDGLIDVHVGSYRITAYVSLSTSGFDITGLSVGSGFAAADVESLALMYSNPEDETNVALLTMSPTTAVEHAARLVSHYEQKRLKAVRRAADEGVPQRVLASLTGVSQATVGRWLKDD